MTDYNKLRRFAFKQVCDRKYLYTSQVENDIPAYIMHYFPNAELSRVKTIVREVAELAFKE